MRPNELALRLLWIFPPLKPGRIETIPRLVGGSVQARLTGAGIYDIGDCDVACAVWKAGDLPA